MKHDMAKNRVKYVLRIVMDWYISQNLVLIKDKDKAEIRGRYKK